MLLTFEQSVDMARERYLTMLAEVSEARKARQARATLPRRPVRLADMGRGEPARAASV